MAEQGARVAASREFQVDRLTVHVHDGRAEMALAAAEFVAASLKRMQAAAGRARVVFAAAPSQNEFLAGLCEHGRVDWSTLDAFHMDEYLGLPASHPASFRRYLNERLVAPAQLGAGQFHPIDADAADSPLAICLRYEERLRAQPLGLVCGGIGENGHLAFNDPPVADALDPVWVKTVRLDAACRRQQVNDGCFATIDEVPTHAITLTLPALMSASLVSIVVPGARKARAVTAALRGPIDESCPASVLRRHAGAHLWLDRESGAGLV